MDHQAKTEKIDVFIEIADGLRLHVELYGAENGRAPIVCLPGLTRNGRDFTQLAALLAGAPHHHRVITITSRGRGLSDRDPNPERYTIPVEAADVIGVLDQLGIEAAHFIGTSRGGLILHVLSFTHLERMKSVILNDIGPVLELDGLRQIQSQLAARQAPADFDAAATALQRAYGAEFSQLKEQDWHDMAAALYRKQDGKLTSDYDPEIAKAFGAIRLDAPLPALWEAFDRLTQLPLMVIRGENSQLLSVQTVDAMAAHKPDLVAIQADGQGHAPILHLDPIAQQIAAFLDA